MPLIPKVLPCFRALCFLGHRNKCTNKIPWAIIPHPMKEKERTFLVKWAWISCLGAEVIMHTLQTKGILTQLYSGTDQYTKYLFTLTLATTLIPEISKLRRSDNKFAIQYLFSFTIIFVNREKATFTWGFKMWILNISSRIDGQMPYSWLLLIDTYFHSHNWSFQLIAYCQHQKQKRNVWFSVSQELMVT